MNSGVYLPLVCVVRTLGKSEGFLLIEIINGDTKGIRNMISPREDKGSNPSPSANF